MLDIYIDDVNGVWDDEKECFVYAKGAHLILEHSLISISKWEEKWHKAFLGDKEHTDEEFLDYIKCMTIAPKVDDSVYFASRHRLFREVKDYINNPMSATIINRLTLGGDGNSRVKQDTPTSELIYYWMLDYHIPFECEKWNLNRLMNLIEICNIKREEENRRINAGKNKGPKKLNRSQIEARNRLNEQRLKAMNSSG